MSQDITREEAAEILNVELVMIDHWLGVGFLASLDRDHVLEVKAQLDRAEAALLEANRLVESLDFMTAEEAAEILGVDLVLLERRVRAGRLTPREIDGKITFKQAEVMVLISTES